MIQKCRISRRVRAGGQRDGRTEVGLRRQHPHRHRPPSFETSVRRAACLDWPTDLFDVFGDGGTGLCSRLIYFSIPKQELFNFSDGIGGANGVRNLVETRIVTAQWEP